MENRTWNYFDSRPVIINCDGAFWNYTTGKWGETEGTTTDNVDLGSELKRKPMDTVADLFDKLSIVNCKIFKYEDIKRMPGAPDKDIADATRATNSLNTQRNQLKNEINEFFKSGTPEIKSYGKTI